MSRLILLLLSVTLTLGAAEVIVRVEGNSLRIDHRRAKDVTLKFYGVDLELLFSKAPFVREDLQRMATVRPTRSATR